MGALEFAILGLYFLTLVILAIMGFHRYVMVWLYFKHKDKKALPAPLPAELPRVTVQLPIFNEMYVIDRLLESVARIRYPKDRLEIQVLDDSTDETTAIASRAVEFYRSQGFDIHYLHRSDRTGYKAGALDAGLKTATGEVVLIFDADFVAPPDILEKTLGHFADPKVGMVQTRWGHINRDFSLLTEVQSIMLDGHFVMEHGARSRSARFFNFNGTAGVWRREVISDAGGWQHDTLTEDMDLSYRAQLRGWRFVYLGDAAVPAELPVEMNAFKSQQFRWAKGQMQVARKLLPAVLRAELPARVKLEAFFHLTNNVAYALLLAVCVLALPNLVAGSPAGPLLAGASLPIVAFYALSQRGVAGGAWRALVRLPCVMALCAGLAVSQARAVVEALAGRGSEFVRTPKHGVVARRQRWAGLAYRSAGTTTAAVELALALYCAAGAVLAARIGHWLTLPFLVIFAAGFGWVGTLSLRQTR